MEDVLQAWSRGATGPSLARAGGRLVDDLRSVQYRSLADGRDEVGRGARVTMPTDVGVVDLMIGFPSANAVRHYDFMQPQLRDAGSATMEFPAEYMFKDVPNQLDEGADPIAVALGRDGPARRRDRAGRASAARSRRRALKEHPDRFRGEPRGRPQRHHRRGAQDPRRARRARHQGGDDVPGGLQPAGAGERPPLLPRLPDVHRPRHPDHRQRRDRRAPPAVGVPGRHALRRGLLRLPRAAHRDAPRRRAVGGRWR